MNYSATNLSSVGVRKAQAQSLAYRLSIAVRHQVSMHHRCVLAGLFLCGPCIAKPFLLPEIQLADKSVQFERSDFFVRSGELNLLKQVRAHDGRRVIEFLADVAPQSKPVPQQEPQKECSKRKCGAYEQFAEDHPIAFNVLLAFITLLIGFALSA